MHMLLWNKIKEKKSDDIKDVNKKELIKLILIFDC